VGELRGPRWLACGRFRPDSPRFRTPGGHSGAVSGVLAGVPGDLLSCPAAWQARDLLLSGPAMLTADERDALHLPLFAALSAHYEVASTRS
jgi:hypothetical protein